MMSQLTLLLSQLMLLPFQLLREVLESLRYLSLSPMGLLPDLHYQIFKARETSDQFNLRSDMKPFSTLQAFVVCKRMVQECHTRSKLTMIKV